RPIALPARRADARIGDQLEQALLRAGIKVVAVFGGAVADGADLLRGRLPRLGVGFPWQLSRKRKDKS
ncbi:MAG TPA: hypothetical protein VHX43_00625, partial [Xanthobacteraceae bacterium]|nr:hypothetical protein [Xanthobacteraceae bacterium]